jgi:hypothetical protein
MGVATRRSKDFSKLTRSLVQNFDGFETKTDLFPRVGIHMKDCSKDEVNTRYPNIPPDSQGLQEDGGARRSSMVSTNPKTIKE